MMTLGRDIADEIGCGSRKVVERNIEGWLH